MPIQLTWSDLADRKVGVWGLGVEGRASVALLRNLGAGFCLVDRSTYDDPELGRVRGLDDGGLQMLQQCDVVVKSPGISRYGAEARSIQDAGVRLVGGLGLWLNEAEHDRVLCVTGTKGKSTTTAIAGHLLRGLGARPFLGGNFGSPPWHPDVVPSSFDTWVIETSSYQATDIEQGPPVVAVTSLDQDHLPWHASDVETYYRDKLSLCTRPGVRSVVANGDSANLRARAELLGPATHWVSAEDDVDGPWLAAMQLLGAHNLQNARIALAGLRALGIPGSEDSKSLYRAGHGFQMLDSRLRSIGAIDGVMFVDDSLSTNVLPTIAALDAFPGRRVALILGGQDRDIDYRPLAVHLAANAPDTYVLTLPDSGPRIAREISAIAKHPPVQDHQDLSSATLAAFRWARPDGIVLLSPAAPSFGGFKDYKDRSRAFQDTFAEIRDMQHT